MITAPPKKKMKHNYTSELELKSLLIRIKNKRNSIGTPKLNKRINKYIRWHTAINAKKYEVPARRNKIKAKLKLKIVELSEQTCCNDHSYERFGEIILLMIKNILRKPQFSGYTYKDDFYSDAIYKILAYLNNFDHLKISERTGIAVNAFAYISQIIHNSILYIINTKKKENERLKKYIQMEQCSHQVPTKDYGWYVDPKAVHAASACTVTRMLEIEEIKCDLISDINVLIEENPEADKLEITYPSTLDVSFDEFNQIKLLAKRDILVTRAKHDD
jgi:hypothetical protein